MLQAGQTQLIVTYPDEPLRDAIEKIVRHNIGRLPVVNRTEPDRVLGYLGRSSILSARLREHEEEEHRHRGPIGLPLANNGARS